MFGWGRRKSRTSKVVEVQADDVVEAPTLAPVGMLHQDSGLNGSVEAAVDEMFAALIERLDSSLADVMRSCDRIEAALAA